jgi:hypothetical protein
VNQNHSLLLKFVHKLHEPDSIPWKNWYLSQHPGELSFIARIVKTELPRYRAITTVVFKWMLNSTLVDTFPALFSHCVQPDITVQAAFGVPLHEQLRPRLTNCAAEENSTSSSIIVSFKLLSLKLQALAHFLTVLTIP